MGMPIYNSRMILWRNISLLMEKKYGCVHISQLSKEAKVGLATIGRIKAQETSIGSDVIDRIASALGAEPWQLLYPDFETQTLESFVSNSPLAVSLARQLESLETIEAQQQAHDLASQVMRLAAFSFDRGNRK